MLVSNFQGNCQKRMFREIVNKQMFREIVNKHMFRDIVETNVQEN